MNETAPGDSFVNQVAARDADTGKNSLSFLLAKSGVRDLFNIEEERRGELSPGSTPT